MHITTRTLTQHKRIALVAHDSCKKNLLNWTQKHKEALKPHILYATGTTGHILERETGLSIQSLLSGPMGCGIHWIPKEDHHVDFLFCD